MRQREDFDRVLLDTLQRAWGAQYGGVTLRLGSEGLGQHWWYHPLLSAFVVAEAHREVRRFLQDSLRYTPVIRRAVPQWVLGSALGSRVGLRFVRRPGFSVTPAIPGAESMALVPGNQRLRVFDFARRRSRVFLKDGFDTRTLLTEIRLRAGAADGPFLRIDQFDEAQGWFEEELLDGFSLPRCPPGYPRRRYTRQALDRLEAWASADATSVEAESYVAELCVAVAADLDAVKQRFGAQPLIDGLQAHLTWLAAATEGLGWIELAASHGDFQPGNIMVARQTRHITIIDWEHFARRPRFYDRLVLGLSSRSARGLYQRVMDFVVGGSSADWNRTLPHDRRWRRQYIALFLLEDLHWFLRESQTGPFRTPSRGLFYYCETLNHLRPAFEG